MVVLLLLLLWLLLVLPLLLLVQRKVDRVAEGARKPRAGVTERKIVT